MKSLIIVDPQNDFISGVFGSKEAQDVLPKIIEYVKLFDGALYYTMDKHSQEDKETRESVLLPKHCIVDTMGQLLPQELEVELKNKGASVYLKNSFMPILSLQDEIKENYKHAKVQDNNNIIYVCGYCTDICVLNTVLYLRYNFPNDTIIVLSNLCAGSTPEKHKMALEIMKSNLIEVEE